MTLDASGNLGLGTTSPSSASGYIQQTINGTNGSYLNWGCRIETFLTQSPECRFIMPFIRTPTNLWRHFSNRIPGFGFNKTKSRIME